MKFRVFHLSGVQNARFGERIQPVFGGRGKRDLNPPNIAIWPPTTSDCHPTGKRDLNPPNIAIWPPTTSDSWRYCRFGGKFWVPILPDLVNRGEDPVEVESPPPRGKPRDHPVTRQTGQHHRAPARTTHHAPRRNWWECAYHPKPACTAPAPEYALLHLGPFALCCRLRTSASAHHGE